MLHHSDQHGSIKGLGKTAKSSPPSPPGGETALRRKLQEQRAKRYELLSVARSIFTAEGVKSGLVYASDFHRTACCKYQPTGKRVGVHQSVEHQKAFFSGLQTCGSVWTCPVCASKIQERRRLEVACAINYAHKNKLQPVLVTFTFPHSFSDKLKDLLDAQATAFKFLRKGKRWDNLKKEIGFVGLIRSLELTFGQNGWHPHTHELFLVKQETDAAELKEELIELWWSACRRAGLVEEDQMSDFYRHAVDVKGNCSASDYLAKQDSSKHWGADREIAKATSKSGRSSGLHPFAFLTEENRNSVRFLEYASAIKGKAQLFWSHGLKEKVGISDKSDQEVAEEKTDNADLLGFLTVEEWALIRMNELRSWVLDTVENEHDRNTAWLKITHRISVLRCNNHPS